MPKPLRYAQALRYNRQIVLPQIDLEGQERWQQARVLVIGIGGLGCSAAQQLCSSGIGHLTLVDEDIVEVTNLPRQCLYNNQQIGMRKVQAARDRLYTINPECTIQTLSKRADDGLLQALIPDHDIVLDCTDNLQSRETINAVCYQHATPLVSGAAIRFEGQLMLVDPTQSSACYGCLSALMQPSDLSCTEAGIFSPVVNMVGTQQAHIALLYLINQSPTQAAVLHTYDGRSMQWAQFTIPTNQHCPVCQGKQKENT